MKKSVRRKAKYYDEHMEYYEKKESLIASHILVDSEEKAEDIIAEIEKAYLLKKQQENIHLVHQRM